MYRILRKTPKFYLNSNKINLIQRLNSNILNEKLTKPENEQIDRINTKYLTKLITASPKPMRPYLELIRLDKPTGSWVIFWPCSWSIAMTAHAGCIPDLYILTWYAIGSVTMRGIGCTINDILDRDIDKNVARTMHRPLCTGAISINNAILFLTGQLMLGLFILLQLNLYTIILSSLCLGLVTLYPLIKRFTHWPQLMLGLTLNWGVLSGYTAIVGHLELKCLPLYLSAVTWTIIYDTIYAHQDLKDDLLQGVKSTAIKFQDCTKIWLSTFALLMTGNLTLAGHVMEQTWPFYWAVGITAGQFSWQIWTLDRTKPNDCGKKFKSNFYVGLIVFVGIVGGNLLKVKNGGMESKGKDSGVELVA